MSGAALAFALAAGVFALFWLIACMSAAAWREKAVDAVRSLEDLKRHAPAPYQDRKRSIKYVDAFEQAVCERQSHVNELGDKQQPELWRAVNDARQDILDRMRPMETEGNE